MNIFQWLVSLFSKVPHNSFPNTNHGLIDYQNPADFVAGTLPFEVRNASADWRQWLPDKDEVQKSSNADAMACVSFSLTNSLEMQARKITGKNYNWSDRFLAKLSGTTKEGNALGVVADTVRKLGLVNESTWATPQDFTWSSFYVDVPDYVKAAAKAEFPFSIAYEWVPATKTSLQYHLQHAPLQITIPGKNPNHAVVLVAIVGSTYYYYDSYAPFLKSMSMPPHAALKVVLTDNRIIMRQISWNDSEEGVYVGFDSVPRQLAFFQAMQQMLPDYRVEEKKWNLGKRPWG